MPVPSSTELTSFRFPTNIRYGSKSRETLAAFADEHHIKRPLLVTDGGLVKTECYGLMTEVLDRVWPKAWHKFDGVHPNPLAEDVDHAYEAYHTHQCDGIVGLGGGSALDAGKALRIKVAMPALPVEEIPLADLPPRLVPFCAIPTTAGTGSEVGRSSVLTVPALGRKVVLGCNPMLPDLAILDPELTRGLPPHLTAATGMDAMTHAIESYVCPVFHPMCDAIALECIRIVREFLPRAVKDGTDLEARGMMLVAASMGAVSFQKDLGAAHSMAHPLSTEFGVHHGLANAVVLPTVVRFNGETDSGQYVRVAEALGIPGVGDAASRVADWLEEFNRILGINLRLRDLKVPEGAADLLASKAIEDGCHLTNPRPCTVEDFRRLYRQVW